MYWPARYVVTKLSPSAAAAATPIMAGVDDSQHRRPLRVLYLHGFEEHPQSPKPQALLTRPDLLQVSVPLLGVYLTHRHSPVLGALLSRSMRVFLALLLAGCTGLYAFREVLGRRLALLCAAALMYYAGKGVLPGLKREAIAWSVRRSFEVACQQLDRFKPDIVVGFSWGGLLAARLLQRKVGGFCVAHPLAWG
jgi:hypothetical protein